MLKLTVTSDIYKCSMTIDRRITIIKGDSGTGKTTLVDMLDNTIYSAKVESSLPILIATNTTWRLVFHSTDSILIFDDLEIVESGEFAKLLKENCVKNNLYLIIISRESLGEMRKLSYSMDSVYEMCTDKDGITHYLVPYYKTENSNIKYSDIKKCLVEDNGKAKKFFESVLNVPVYSSDGKANVVRKLENIHNGEFVLLFIDRSAFGCHADELRYMIIMKKIICEVPIGYECFEEMLLNANIVNKNSIVITEMSDLFKYANQFISWERFFEDLLARATEGTKYSYKHSSGKLSSCYMNKCDVCNSYIKNKCDFAVDGDKLKALFEGTKYEWILEID